MKTTVRPETKKTEVPVIRFNQLFDSTIRSIQSPPEFPVLRVKWRHVRRPLRALKNT